MDTEIDVTFDVYSDTPKGKDPDSHSKTLRLYHKKLWSKPLPGGQEFTLTMERAKPYLHHKSELGEFPLSSDSLGHTYRYVKAMAQIIDQIPVNELDKFYKDCSTIGAYVLFPSNQIDGKRTINGGRGLDRKIRDRFDLTLECIRRHYAGQKSPLSEILARYSDFFDLFQSFNGYVDFFLFQDLVSDDGNLINFYLPFDNFETSPLPSSVAEYRQYRDGVVAFIKARNQRIAQF